MVFTSSYTFSSFKPSTIFHSQSHRITAGTLKYVTICSSSLKKQEHLKRLKISTKDFVPFCSSRFCPCVTRRQFIEVLGSAPLSTGPSMDSNLPSNDSLAMLNKIHPPRPDWYEKFYALALKYGTKAYEAEIADYKAKLFASLSGKANKILELGIGTGPNLKYYANEPGVQVIGVDPIKKMEKYACAAAASAGLPASNFRFMQAVGEGLPVDDASVDAVVGTLVLCSVKDVNLTLQGSINCHLAEIQKVMRVLKPGGFYLFVEHVAAEDGTIRRWVQGVLDPLQQFLADGCHLTRKTGEILAKAGFSKLEIQQVSISAASIINPHVYGIAYK